MIKFTKEEISLCKQIEEKHRKEINKEDYAYDEDDREKVLIDDCNAWVESKKTELYRLKDDGTDLGYKVKHWFPLWTISDCLEFLNKKRFAIENLHQPGWKNWSILIKHENVLHINDAKWTGKELEIRSNKTPLEACLKAVLAVLEEGK